MINPNRLFGFLATGAVPEMTALDESLADHDKKYHPKGFDPENGTCGKRRRQGDEDASDDIVPQPGTRFRIRGFGSEPHTVENVYSHEDGNWEVEFVDMLSRWSKKDLDKYGTKVKGKGEIPDREPYRLVGKHDDNGPWVGAELFYDGDPISDWSFDEETGRSDIVGKDENGNKVRLGVDDELLTWK